MLGLFCMPGASYSPLTYERRCLLAVVGVCGFVWLLWGSVALSAAAQSAADDPPVLQAHHVTSDIVVDGTLQEEDWKAAAVASEFQQFEPEEGARPSQRTEVRILYGESGLYVGAQLFDEEPEAIQNRLTRRDNRNQADWFDISIDSRFNRQTAYTFAVNAAGVQRDGIDRDGLDTSWDAIWESAVAITAEGWTVEMYIPYSMLRFSGSERQRWGLQLERRIARTGEVVQWAFTPRTELGGRPVAAYGVLEGLEELMPRRNIQIFPYTVSQVDIYEGDEVGTIQRDPRLDGGADAQVGFGSNITLNVTVNPDFGQVQSDPASLNLTAFETTFAERRPFFTEGAQFFDFTQEGGDLLYTRRIGAEAPIIGATKLTGRTAGGLSLGGLAAVEGGSFTPERYYGVVNVQQDVGTYSTMGGILTAFDGVREEINRRTFSGGVDWDLRFAENTYQVRGHASLTHRAAPDAPGLAPTTGVSASARLARVSGATTYRLDARALGPNFNSNDLGQLDENNVVRLRGRLEHELNDGQSFRVFQRVRGRLELNQRLTYDGGLDLGLGHSARTTWTFRNFSRIRLESSSDFLRGGFDLFETRGLGLRARPREFEAELDLGSDSRRDWRLEPSFEITTRADGGRSYEAEMEVDWDVNPYLSFSVGAEYEHEDAVVEWVANETVTRNAGNWMLGEEAGRILEAPLEVLDALFGPRQTSTDEAIVPVYGQRDTRALNLEMSGDVTLSPQLSIELFGQLFGARGRYDSFQVLQTPKDLADFPAYPRRYDFATSSFIFNTILRWEYRPGSELFVVWAQARDLDLDDPFFFDRARSSPYTTALPNRMGDVFGMFPNNTFTVKLRYAFTN